MSSIEEIKERFRKYQVDTEGLSSIDLRALVCGVYRLEDNGEALEDLCRKALEAIFGRRDN